MLLVVVWRAIPSILTGGFVLSSPRDQGVLPWDVWLFIAGFWAVGAGLLLPAPKMGLRQAKLTVAGDTL